MSGSISRSNARYQSPPKVRYFVDWLSLTVKSQARQLSDLKYQAANLTSTRATEWLTCKPMHGYYLACKHEFGALAMSGREDMGVHLTLSGQALHNFGVSGHTLLELLDQAYRFDTHTVRLDLAIDAIDSGLNIAKMAIATKDRKAQSLTSIWDYHQSQDSGETLYIGAPSSDKRMRIYNKAAETGMSAVPNDTTDWIRIELQSRNEQAERGARRLVMERKEPTVVKSLLRGFYDLPDYPRWAAIFEDSTPDPGISFTKVTDTQGWLLGVVAKTLAREVEVNRLFLSRFLRAVFDERRRIKEQKR